jgi:hypothetical protein
MSPLTATICASADYDGTVLLTATKDVERALVDEEIAPETIHDMGNIMPANTIVLGTIDARKTLLRLMILRTPGPEVVM